MTTYSTGTISVGAGSTAVTGVGTNWLTAGVRAGDRLIANGLVGIIDTVGSATSITLKRAWPGAGISGGNYDIEMVDDGVRALTAANALLQALGAGTLTSLGAIASAANTMPYWSGAGVMASTGLTSAMRTLLSSSLLSVSGSNLVTAAGARVTGEAVTQSVTDLTAGRLLKVGDFGLSAAGATVPNNNVDDITATGSYAITAGVVSGSPALTGISISGSGFLHLAFDANSALQIMTHRTTGVTYVRTKSVGAWGTFRPLVEGGSNANGEYVRFADGRQICSRVMAASAAGAATWTFPAAFSSAPSVTGTAQATVNSGVVLDAAPSATAATFSARDKTDSRRADTVHLQAVGRWF